MLQMKSIGPLARLQYTLSVIQEYTDTIPSPRIKMFKRIANILQTIYNKY